MQFLSFPNCSAKPAPVLVPGRHAGRGLRSPWSAHYDYVSENIGKLFGMVYVCCVLHFFRSGEPPIYYTMVVVGTVAGA